MPAPTIDEVQLPPEISRGAVGGPSFSTIVTVGATGAEQRIGQWSVARHKWTISFEGRDPTEATTLLKFYFARRGKLRGFRFKDWNDFQATQEPLTVTGSKTYQLVKTYTSLVSYVREIYKIVSSPAVTMRRNGGSFTAFSVDVNTGIITLTPDVTRNIGSITQSATPTVTTTVAHGYTTGNKIYIEGVNGMTQINGRVVTISTGGGSSFTITDLDTSGFSPYVSGGVADKYVQPSETLDWTGQFDVPVRFDIDEMLLTQDDVLIRSWLEIPVIELRG
jgi:uncharacterized protein (TIGR02217 family)